MAVKHNHQHLPAEDAPGVHHPRRHSHASHEDQPAPTPSPAPEDYPDTFFEASEEAVPILRHPYYNELTEDLGQAAETWLEEDDQQQAYEQAYEDIPDDEGESPRLETAEIPLVSVDICERQVDLKEPEPVESEDTCHINYTLLRRFLETLEDAQLSNQTQQTQPDRFTFYSSKTGFVRTGSLLDISPNLVEVMQSGAFWLDICAPSPLELKVFGEVFRMHQLTLEDLQLDDVREKCDVFEDYFIVCLKAYEAHAASVRPDYNSPVNLYVLSAGKACVVSIHHQPLHFSQTIAKRIRLLSARTGLSTDWITYGIMDDVIDSFSPAIYDLESEIELIDDACMQPGVARCIVGENGPTDEVYARLEVGSTASASNNNMFHRITASRKTLTQLTRLVAAKNEAVRNVLKRCTSRLSEDALVYLRDLQDHVHTMEQSLEHADDALNRAYSNFLAHISIETSHTSNRMSRVMKTLSAFAAVTTPCTVVSCLLGMNLKGPFWPYGDDRHGPGSGSGGPYDFALVVGFILSATVALVYVGKRNDWF
mgnify:CR=1 FL=1